MLIQELGSRQRCVTGSQQLDALVATLALQQAPIRFHAHQGETKRLVSPYPRKTWATVTTTVHLSSTIGQRTLAANMKVVIPELKSYSRRTIGLACECRKAEMRLHKVGFTKLVNEGMPTNNRRVEVTFLSASTSWRSIMYTLSPCCPL